MKILNLISILFLMFPLNQKCVNNKIKNGEITYSVYILDYDSDKNKEIDKELKEQMNVANQEISKIEFKLNFNEEMSFFEVIDKLETDDANQSIGLKLAKTITGVTEKYYKNLKSKEKLKFSDRYSKSIIYELPFEEFDWVLTKESKKINGYLCYKAYTNVKQLNETTNVLRYFTPTVWYCPEIPVSYGPRGLDGLPGLVLEATFNGKITFVANKIELSGKKVIEKPIFKGKKIKKVIYEKN